MVAIILTILASRMPPFPPRRPKRKNETFYPVPQADCTLEAISSGEMHWSCPFRIDDVVELVRSL